MPKATKSLQRIRSYINKHGPLYVAALYPCDVVEPGYTPWFLAHTDEAQLGQGKIDDLFRLFAGIKDVDEAEAIEEFADFLERSGYIVLNSAGIDNSGYLLVNQDSPEKPRKTPGSEAVYCWFCACYYEVAEGEDVPRCPWCNTKKDT